MIADSRRSVLRIAVGITTLAIPLLLASACTAAGATWTVDDSGGAGVNFTTIQAAVDAASPGDTIKVASGTYHENVDVWKRVTLIGAGADVVTVRAADVSDDVFYVTADWVNISGFTVTGATGSWNAGIHLYNADHCNIYDNNVSDDDYGIYLRYSSNNTLTDNTANSNNWLGIILSSSSNNTLSNNIASTNGIYGIFLSHSSNNNVLSDNIALNNIIGLEDSSNNTLMSNIMSYFDLQGHIDLHFDNQIDTSNLVNGKPIYYIKGATDTVYNSSTNAGVFYCISCVNVTVKNKKLNNNSARIFLWNTTHSRIQNVSVSNGNGISLRFSSNNSLTNNTANSNSVGILLYSSNNNTLANNNANNNTHGISLYSSSNNALTCNKVLNNYYGILLYNSICSNNRIYHNNFGRVRIIIE